MKRVINFTAIVALIVAMVACDEVPLGGLTPPPSGKVLQIEAMPAGDFTKATDTAFEVGDAFNLYGFKGDANNGVSTWLPWLLNGKFTKTESGFTPEQTYYWYEGEEKGILIGLYPYNATHTTEALATEGVNFCVKSDQSNHAGYTASDLMTAFKPEVTPTEESVVLEFDHLLSKLIIDINNQTSNAIKEVYLDGVNGNINYSFTAGVTLQDGKGTIKAGKLATATEGYTDTYVLIIPPQTVAPSIVVTTTNNKQYTYNTADNIEFRMGKVRHLMATITEESISTEIDAVVNDWSADENVEFSQQGDGNQGGNNQEPTTPTPTHTLAEVLALGTGATIESAIVEGVVISNLELNNLTSKKGLYIQDPTAGMQFYLDNNHNLAFGDHVQINLSGAAISEYNGAVQVSGVTLDKITKISSGNIVEPRLISIEDLLSNKYESQYVAIRDVQVVDADLGKTWVMDGSHTSITMEDAQGNNFVVFSSKYATYGAEVVAQGSGWISGIAGCNKGNIQIIFAQESDFAGLTNNRLGDNQFEVEGMSINPKWNVAYVPEYYDVDSDTTYYDLIQVASTDEENGFFVEFFDETYFNESIKPNIAEYVNLRAASLVEQLNKYNAENGADFNMLNFKNYHFGLYDMMNILNPGRVVVAMWGMTIEGEVTGLYYISDVIEIKDPATPEYLSWLGTFVISEQGESTTTSTITISRNVVNESYLVSGWNGIANYIVAGFDPNGGWEGGGSLEFYAQTVLSDFYVGETHIVDLYFGGLVAVGDALAPLITAGDKLAQADWLVDTNSTFINHYTYTLNGEEAPVTQIGFLASLDDGGMTYITSEIHSITTSLLMKRVENTEPAAVARKHNLFDEGSNGIARSLDEVRKEHQPQWNNYVVGGRKFNAINF